MSCITKCCGAQGADSGEKVTCAPQGVAQITLLVCSLLFGAAAVASHFGGLGLPGVVAFSVASGLSMAGFVGLCIRTACDSSAIRVENDFEETSMSTRPAYELEIDAIRKRSQENPLKFDYDFEPMIPVLEKYSDNSAAMDYLVKQYGEREARFLGMWIISQLSVPLLNAVRKDEEVFGKVVEYWFSELNIKVFPITLLLDLSDEEEQCIVDKALAYNATDKKPTDYDIGTRYRRVYRLLTALSSARHAHDVQSLTQQGIECLQESILQKICKKERVAFCYCLKTLKFGQNEVLFKNVMKDLKKWLTEDDLSNIAGICKHLHCELSFNSIVF